MHFYDHDHGSATSEAAHQKHVHFDDTVFEAAHPGEIEEVELYQQGLLKNKLSGLVIIALFVAVMMTFLPLLLIRVAWRRDCYVPLSSYLFSLRPPLRAPPLN